MNKPLVTCIVPHHLDKNSKYLEWCVKSILASIHVDLEVIVISDADGGWIPFNDKRATCIWDKSLSNVTKKWHHGLTLASESSQYVMLISDDVMVSKHTIAAMAGATGDTQVIMSPASNCDSTTRYYTKYYLSHGVEGTAIGIGLKSTLEDIKGYEQCVIDYPASQPILIDPGWVSFYCTMFPKTVLKRVGDFDEALDVRHNDVDYCHRARALGIPSLIHLGVFALHFGDRTLPSCTTAQDYANADEACRRKYQPQVE